MQSCKFCQNGGNCIQPFICVPPKKEDLIFDSISQLDELPNDLMLTARRTSEMSALEVRSNSSRALSTITDREEEAEEADDEDGSDEDIELLLKKTRILTHSQSAHADLAKHPATNKRSLDQCVPLEETNESEDSDDEFYVHKILLPFKKSKSTAGFLGGESSRSLKTETIKLGTFKASKIMDVIEKQTKDMLKASEEPVANFAPSMDLSWPAPESRRESKCETNIDNLLDLSGFEAMRRGSSTSTHTKISECWSAPGQIQIDLSSEEEDEDPVCAIPNSWSAPDRIRTLSDEEEEIVYSTRKNISYSSEQICSSTKEFFPLPSEMKDHLSADDLYFLAAGEERPEDSFIRFNIEDVDEDMDNIRRISEAEDEFDEMNQSTAIDKSKTEDLSYDVVSDDSSQNSENESDEEMPNEVENHEKEDETAAEEDEEEPEEDPENAQSSSTIDLGPSRKELEVLTLPTSKSDSHLRFLMSRPKTPCFGETNPANKDEENIIEIIHSTASSPIDDFVPNGFVRQSKSLTFPGEIYTRAISSDDEGLVGTYHRCDSTACQAITKEIYEKKFGSKHQDQDWEETSDDDIVLGDLKIPESYTTDLDDVKFTLSNENPLIEQLISACQIANQKIPDVLIQHSPTPTPEIHEKTMAEVKWRPLKDRNDDIDKLSMVNNPRSSTDFEDNNNGDENQENHGQEEPENDDASVKTFTVEDDDIPMADDPSVESPIRDFIVKKYMDALLLSKSPPIASEDEMSDFDATEVATEVGEDEEIGERLEMKHEEDAQEEAMDDGSDTDLDSPIEDVADHIKLYNFSGVSFRSGKIGKSQSDYAVLKNRRSAPCDETVGNYNYWIQQGKKWDARTQENEEIYSIPKSATVSYELRHFHDSFLNRNNDESKNRISPLEEDGMEKAETSRRFSDNEKRDSHMSIAAPRILSSPGCALAKAFSADDDNDNDDEDEVESEPVYANLENMAPSEDVPECPKMEVMKNSNLQMDTKLRKSATSTGFQGNSIIARPRRKLPKRPDMVYTPEEQPTYANLPCSSSYYDQSGDRFAEYKSPYVQHYYKAQNLVARSMIDMKTGIPRNTSTASLHGSIERYGREDYGIVPATTPIGERPSYQASHPHHPTRPTNLLLPSTPSSHNLAQYQHHQSHPPDRRGQITTPKNSNSAGSSSTLLHQEPGATTATTLADELALAAGGGGQPRSGNLSDSNQPMHAHKAQRNAYTLNGGREMVGEQQQSTSSHLGSNSCGSGEVASNQDYFGRDATSGYEGGRRPVREILAEVLDDSRRSSRYSGDESGREEEMRRKEYSRQMKNARHENDPYHDRGAYCDYETPVSPMNVLPSPLGRGHRRLPPLPISSTSAAILSQFGLPANFAMQSPQRAYYSTFGSGIPHRTHPPANQPQPKEDHQLCFGIDQSIIRSSNYGLEDSYYEDGLNGNQGFIGRRSTSLYNQEDSSGISSCCTNSEHLNPTHRAQTAFVPRHEDEILLEIGDAVHVERECEDHWCYGTNLRTGKYGIFPSAHVCEIDFVDEIVSGVLPQPSRPFKQERDTFYLTMLASVEVAHHKGNDVLIQAINKVCAMYQNKEEIVAPSTVLMEISFRGIHVIDKKRKDIFRCPTFDYFYSLQNISFCGAHPKQLRYFGFITKHPLLPRFACHVFLSNESTQAIVESIGRAFKRSYDEYMAFAHPTEDIYIE